MWRARTWLSLVVLALALPSPARADDLDVARKHNRKAIEFLKRGDHRSAIMEMQEAYAASPRPNILFNLGHAYELASGQTNVTDMGRAIEYYERYLTERKDAPDRREVLDLIEKLRTAIHTHEAEVHPAEARAKPAEALPMPEAPPPGMGKPAASEPARASSPPATTAPIAASPVAQPRRAAPSGRRLMGALVLGAGVALAIGGGILLGLAPGEVSHAPTGKTIQDFYDQKDAAGTMRLAGAFLAGVGVVAVIGGIVFIALPERREKNVSLWLTPLTNGLALGGTF